MPAIILILLFLVLPYFLVKFSKKLRLDKILGDIVVCYGFGIFLGNTKQFWLHAWGIEYLSASESQLLGSSKELAGIAVILAIPMLLMINDMKIWLRHAAKSTIIFLIFSAAVASVCFSIGNAFRESIPQHDIAAGMMTGVYIGGTPNMVAISKALNAEESMFTLLNATDTFCSAIYLLFMFSLAKPLLRFVLPAFKSNYGSDGGNYQELEAEKPFPPMKWTFNNIRPLLIALLIAILSIGISIIPALLLPDANGEMNSTLLILLLTSIGIALSFFHKVRTLPGVYNFAQYLLLVFALSTGFLADFAKMISEGGNFLAFNAIIISLILAAHIILAVILRVDVDSFIICSCANVMGPPFIGQTCAAIKNKELIPVGISLGLLGLAIANYVGVLVSYLL